jgi:hypothetical protein
MQSTPLWAMTALLLLGAHHPTPTVVLVEQGDAIRSSLPGARQFFVRTVTIGKDDLARVRQDIEFSPEDPSVKFFLGKRVDGTTTGVVLFPQVNTLHGPLEVALAINPDGTVASATVTKATVETKPWVLEAIRAGLLQQCRGLKYGDDLANLVKEVQGSSMVQWQAQTILTAVRTGLILHHVLFKG